MDDLENTNQMPNVAAIDLGTNSNRLLIADVHGNAVFRDVRHVALGDGLASTGKLCDEAMERAICSFMDFTEMMHLYGVCHYRAIATAACRMSSNTEAFIEEVKKSSGVKLEVISEFEEARLTLKGASLNAPKDKKYLYVYDLGGGSTEVTLALNGDNPEILETISIPLGARNAAEKYNLKNYHAERAAILEKEVQTFMEDFLVRAARHQVKSEEVAVIATSSTPLRLAAWINHHPTYDKFKADGVVVPVSDLEQVIDDVFQGRYSKRVRDIYIGPTRAPIFVAATIIFRTIYKALGATEVVASLKAAQEAIIKELIDKMGESSIVSS